MSVHSQNGPLCRFCGRNLSFNETTGQYECLACTYRKMEESGNTVDIGFEEGQAYQTATEQEYEEIRKIQEFQESLKNAAPNLFVTKTLIAINVAIYLYVSFKGGNFSNPSTGLLETLGASKGELIFAGGEWWRTITSMFLHGGLVHLAFNMYALWIIGNIVEKLFGEIAFTAIYFTSGVLGNMLSLYNHPADVVGVGASGAVFGIFGALVAYAYFRKMPKQISSNILKNAGLMMVINLAIGLSIPQIDNSAHIGGCIAGFVAAFFIGQDINAVNRPKRIIASISFSAFTLALVVFAWDFVGAKNKTNVNEVKLLKNRVNQSVKAIDQDHYYLMKSYNNLIAQPGNKESFLMSVNDFIEKHTQESISLQRAFKKNSITKEFANRIKKYFELRVKYWKAFKKFVETDEITFYHKAESIDKQITELVNDAQSNN